jgi:mono/diheme cytochrome c family protein
MVSKKLFLCIGLIGLVLIFSCNNSKKNSSEVSQEIQEPDYSAGKKIYLNHCAECHQENGEGIPGAFPALIGKEAESEKVLNGVEGTIMAAYKDSLDDDMIAELLNFINHSWENNYKEISTETVKEIREL